MKFRPFVTAMIAGLMMSGLFVAFAEAETTSIPGLLIDYSDERARVSSNSVPAAQEPDYSYLVPKAERPVQQTPIEKVAPAKPVPPPKMVNIVGNSYKGMVLWDLCDERSLIRGGKGQVSGAVSAKREKEDCADEEQIHPTLLKYVSAYLLSCTKVAAAKAGYPEPARLYLNIDQPYVNRTIRHPNGPSRKKSQHAFGRALDIYSMTLIDAKGGRTFFGTNVNQKKVPGNVTFYNEFRECWNSKLDRCDETNGSIGRQGTPGESRRRQKMHSNSYHNTHIHLQASARCGGST